MPRTSSLALIAHMSSPSATIGYLNKIGPLPNGNYIRLCSLGRNEIYDDGTGAATYYARTGLQLANLASSNDLSTDNTEGKSLVEIPAYPGQGVTQAMVDNGDLDDVPYVIYAINYEDHSMGHLITGGGPLGKVGISPDGQLVNLEMRSWCDLLRQNGVCDTWSIRCRVKKFGSQPGDEPFPCNYDLSSEWVNGIAVTDVDAESVRDFTASGLLQGTDYFAPGLIEWVTGANAGRFIEVESFTSGGVISLMFMLRHAVQEDDIFNIRRDCTREWEGNNSCDTFNNRQWYRGEPFTPVADAIGLTVPGAAAGGFSDD